MNCLEETIPQRGVQMEKKCETTYFQKTNIDFDTS